MTIGIDLSSLQGAHRMRGIGYTLLNFINNISEADRGRHQFVFYVYPDSKSPLGLLNLENMSYEVRNLSRRRRSHRRLRGRLQLLVSTFNQLVELKDLYLGDSRIKDLKGVDFFLQTDQSQPLPRRKRGMKNGLIIYDIIPYVLEWDYMWTYATARQHGFSRKASLRVYARRWLYARKIKVTSRRSNILFSISEHTKQDFIKYLGVSPGKVVTTPLGVNLPKGQSQQQNGLKHYVETSWGYMERNLNLSPGQAFILYVGGPDKRRKLPDLIAAFNMLRARGYDLKLMLAGDCMQGPSNIAVEETQHALRTSSYLSDIIFMGFVDDATRDWLYSQAKAFVFPSRYEGFGLPVLEAMSYGTPVVCYDNAATREVAGSCPHYAQDVTELFEAIKSRLEASTEQAAKERRKNAAHAKQWKWHRTSESILDGASRA